MPKQECTPDKHVEKFNLCQYCERETICRNCTNFHDDLHVCMLCYVTLKARVTERDGDRSDSYFNFVSDRPSMRFDKTSITRDKETGEIAGFEQFCAELGLTDVTLDDKSQSELAKTYKQSTQAKYSVSVGDNPNVLHLSLVG